MCVCGRENEASIGSELSRSINSPAARDFQSNLQAEARFKCLRFAPLSRNASIIFTVRQKRNLLVDKDRTESNREKKEKDGW